MEEPLSSKEPVSSDQASIRDSRGLYSFARGGRRRLVVAGLVLLLAVLPSLAGCQLTYLAHLGVGQARVLLGRTPIETVLEKGGLDERQREALQLVLDAREYAFEHIGLKRTASYGSYYDTGGGPVSWNVTGCAADRFEPVTWWFPIVGRVPYKGYFDKASAQAEAARLEARGMDTLVSPVAAYSTLGWFADPILSTMLDYPEDQLVELVIHELTHATIYVPGDSTFNENVATFVGRQGAHDFLVNRHGAGAEILERAELLERDQESFAGFIDGLHGELEELYALDLPRDQVLRRRAEVFRRAHGDLKDLRRAMATGAYASMERRPLNNAVILAYRTYHRDLAIFEAVWRQRDESLPEALGAFVEASEAADPVAALKATVGG